MLKGWNPTQYKRKRDKKYLIMGLILVFIILTVSAYSDIPQLEPIRKQIEISQPKLQNLMGVGYQFERATIGGIVSNPEEYVGENVSVDGWLNRDLLVRYRLQHKGALDLYLVDKQGYGIYLIPPLPYQSDRQYPIGGTYRVKGEVVYLEVSCMVFPYTKTKTLLVLKPKEMTKIC